MSQQFHSGQAYGRQNRCFLISNEIHGLHSTGQQADDAPDHGGTKNEQELKILQKGRAKQNKSGASGVHQGSLKTL